MNEKTRIQIEEMKRQTIGVEVEMNNITRENAARIAADYFGTGRYKYTADRNGYYTWSAWDTEGREWKFQRDVSIAGVDSEKCELVTPILKYEDIPLLQELIRRLRKAKAKSDATRGCGVHIHIGANGHTAQTLRNLANIMASHERLIASALNISQSRIISPHRQLPETLQIPSSLQSPSACSSVLLYSTDVSALVPAQDSPALFGFDWSAAFPDSVFPAASFSPELLQDV